MWTINPALQTGTLIGNNTGSYTGSSLQFLNPTTLFTFDIDTTGNQLDRYAVGASGLTGSYSTDYTLNSFSAFKIRGGLAYANYGGVANPATTPASQLGAFLPPVSISSNSSAYYQTYGQLTEPDPSLGLSFFANSAYSGSSSNQAVVSAYNQSTYMLTGSVALPSIFGSAASSNANLVDFTRWGQDGLALLTSTGEIALLRGGFVVPQELQSNSAASLISSSITSVTHGTANTLLTLTGSNFLPGVAVTWNGSYRTTTIVDATHVTVAIPAADLASAGSGSLVATNPGASPSSALTITIN